MLERAAFARGMAMLDTALTRGQAPDPKAVRARHEVFYAIVRDLDAPIFEQAVLRCLRTAKFLPVPSELLEAAAECRQEARGLSLEAEAAAAFAAVRDRGSIHELCGIATQLVRCVTCREASFYRPDDARACQDETHERATHTRIDHVPECRKVLGCESRWDEALIRQHLGWAAADAFVAIGGNEALASLREDDVRFALRDFVKAYMRAVKERPSTAAPVALLTAGSQPAAARLTAGAVAQ